MSKDGSHSVDMDTDQLSPGSSNELNSDLTGDKMPTTPRLRRFSTSGLSPNDEKMLNTLLEKLETVSTALPGPEAHLEFHRNWVPLQVTSKNTLLRWWIEYMHNPLIQETVTIPRAIAEMPDEQLIWRMTVNFMRKLFAEFIGTFVMTFWAGAIRVLAVTGNTDLTGVTLQIAGMAIGIIYSIAHVSGAHLNTAVTWMFMIRGIFPIKWAILYWCIQLIGAILAGAFVLAMFGSESGAISVNDYNPNVVPNYVNSGVTAMCMEAITWWFLGLVIQMNLKNIEKVGVVFPIIIGWTLISIGQINGIYTGWSSNPIRTLGPCIIFDNCQNEWIYFGGPMIGATVSVVTVLILDHKIRAVEPVAACGGPVTPIY